LVRNQILNLLHVFPSQRFMEDALPANHVILNSV